MAYIEITRRDQPTTLWAATIYIPRRGHVIPSGFYDTPGEAVRGLVHILEEHSNEGDEAWARSVAVMEEPVERFFKENPDRTWARFELPRPDEPLRPEGKPAIIGLPGGTSEKRGEEILLPSK